MRSLRVLFTVLAVLWALPAAAAEDGARDIDQLMRKSGLWTQVGQIQEQMRAGAEQARAERKKSPEALSEEGYARLAAAMGTAFAPDRLRESLAKELAREVSPEHERAALEWLSSELGKRITRIEEDGGRMEQVIKAEREAPKFLASQPAARVALCTRLAEAIRAGEAGAEMMINVTSAVFYGIALTTQLPDGVALNAVRSRLEAQRPQLVEGMMKRTIQQFAYAYRGLSDEELGRYVAFSESPAGRGYNEGTMKAMSSVLIRASLDMGQAMGAMAPPERRRPS